LGRFLGPVAQKFIELLTIVHQKEQTELLPFLETSGYPIKYIAHGCGLMVLSSYNGQGLATKLATAGDKLLKEKGFMVKVVKTTNIGSRRTYEKNGYVEFAFFALDDFGIELDDRYSIMYKIL